MRNDLSTVQHAEFCYGGGVPGASSAPLRLEGAEVTVSEVVVHGASRDAILIAGDASVTIQNSLLYSHSRYGVYAEPGPPRHVTLVNNTIYGGEAGVHFDSGPATPVNNIISGLQWPASPRA